MTSVLKDGWGWPLSSRKAHYFEDGKSICDRYGLYYGELFSKYDFNEEDLCKRCERKLAKKVEKIG